MDKLSAEIWKAILPVDKEPVARKPRPAKDAPPQPDHFSRAILMERAAYLRKLAAASDGQASETLREYPNHAAMLSFRARDGVAELHENFADLFHVLDGRATLVTGGQIVGRREVGPGEVRGDRVEGGQRQELLPGDIAHIPAGVPHQMLVSGAKTFTAFVLKIRETPVAEK